MTVSLKKIEIWNLKQQGSETSFKEELGKIFPNFQFEIQNRMSDAKAYPKAESLIPHLLIVDQRNSLDKNTPAHDQEKFIAFCRRDIEVIRKADPQIPILFLLDKQVTGEDSRKILDQGVTLLLAAPHRLSEIETALKDLLTKRFETFSPRSARVEAKHRIQLKIASIEQALAAETLNIGSGGLFIRMRNPEIKVGDHVDFELQMGSNLSHGASSSGSSEDVLSENPIEAIEKTQSTSGKIFHGSGTVAWVRLYAESAKSPEGVGIRFKVLSPEIANLISKYLMSSTKVIPES